MKQALAILLVIACVAALSSATVYAPRQDTYLRYSGNAPGTTVSSDHGWDIYGNNTNYRAGKGYQDRFVVDFDRAAILADLTAQLGRPPTAVDFTSGNLTMTLSLMGATMVATDKYYPAYFTSTTEGAFATATEYRNQGGYNQASYNAAANSDPANPGAILLWNGGVDQHALGDDSHSIVANTIGDCPVYIAGHSYQAGNGPGGILWTAANYTYQDFPYPADLAWSYLTDPNFAYLTPYGTPANSGASYCYSTEQPGGAPKLTFAVPEPCSMLLIAVGGVATLIRRRK